MPPLFVGRGNTTQQWRIPNGSLANPAISFTSAPTSGIYYANSNIIVCVSGANVVSFGSSGLTTQGTLTASSFSGNGANLTNISVVPSVSISNVQITDSNFALVDDTAVANTGGYFLVNGSGFASPLDVIIGASTIPSSVTVVSPNQLRVTMGPSPNGTVPLTVSANGFTTFKSMALSISPFPVWQSASVLSNVTKNVAFTQSLVATEGTGSNVTYSLDTGSSLPSGVTLYSNGVLTGNIVTDPGNTTTYNFTVQASDLEYQNIPRTFNFSAVTPVVIASGGTITTSGGYTIHTFLSSNMFTVSSNPTNKTFEVLVVAGGGGGGSRHAGGGGAGGLLYYATYGVAVGTHAITIGGGGTGEKLTLDGNSLVTTVSSTNGGNSSLGSLLTATGGGKPNAAGGSGGGGGGPSAGGAGTAGQGNAGGSGTGSGAEVTYTGGGGGGAGTAGTNGNSSGYGGNGGTGLQISISGVATYYAGGGGGGISSAGVTAGSGGTGGGGAGSKGTANATSGTVNTGGGGGGSGLTANDQGYGGNGGSGIVIIRYLT